jgi:hypothetical protein
MIVADLIDELSGLKSLKPRHKLVGVLANLPTLEREALASALADPELSSEGIGRALRASGHTIGVSSVKRFRRDVLGMAHNV